MRLMPSDDVDPERNRLSERLARAAKVGVGLAGAQVGIYHLQTHLKA